MQNLLLDIGNSDIKAASGTGGKNSVKLLKRFSYSKNHFESDLRDNLSELSRLNFISAGISIQDVTRKSNIKKIIRKIFNLTPVFIERKLISSLILKIDYAEGLGNDRICNAVAAKEIYGRRNMLVIDFGTATTFTLLSDGILKGGLICPGLITSLQTLSMKTKLPVVNIKKPDKLFYKNTAGNINGGIYYHTFFAVKGIIREFRNEFRDLFVITTGGLSGMFFTGLAESVVNDKNLTLKGINIIINQ